MERETDIQQPISQTTHEDSEDIEYWSESSGSDVSCYASDCECHDSDWEGENKGHDYKKTYVIDREYVDEEFLINLPPDYLYEKYLTKKHNYEKTPMDSVTLFTKPPSRALLKFMEKGRFNCLTFVRYAGTYCEWCCKSSDYVYHMQMFCKWYTSFDVCRLCMIELQPILENYDANIQEFKDVLKRNKSRWDKTPYHLQDTDTLTNNREYSYTELSDVDAQLYRKPIDIGPQFTKDSPEILKLTILNSILYKMVMCYPKLKLDKDVCVNCDICEHDTKLYIMFDTKASGDGYYNYKTWRICVKCVYRFDYLIASYLIDKWDEVIAEHISDTNKLIAIRNKIIGDVCLQ